MKAIGELMPDRDSKFSSRVERSLKDAGVNVVDTGFQTPNMNAFAERWVRSVKTGCLNRMILLGEDSLRRALKEHGARFHTERPHQGLGNGWIKGPETTTAPGDRIVEHERLGGLLRSCQRAA